MDEAPSKTLLLERRAEEDMVREGKSVLEDRRDLLAHMLVEQLELAAALSTRATEILHLAASAFRRTVMRHGQSGLARFAAPTTPFAAGTQEQGNRLGTPWLEHSLAQSTDTGLQLQPHWESSVELEGTLRALHDLIPTLLQLAVADNNLLRLTEVYRRTQRRVNSLEHIVLPELQRTIREMENRMDEMERDDLVRSLLIKRQQS